MPETVPDIFIVAGIPAASDLSIVPVVLLSIVARVTPFFWSTPVRVAVKFDCAPAIAASTAPFHWSPTLTGPFGRNAVALNIFLLKSMPGAPMPAIPGIATDKILPVGSMTWVNGWLNFACASAGSATSLPFCSMCMDSIFVDSVAAPSAGRTDLTVWIVVICIVIVIGIDAPDWPVSIFMFVSISWE